MDLGNGAFLQPDRIRLDRNLSDEKLNSRIVIWGILVHSNPGVGRVQLLAKASLRQVRDHRALQRLDRVVWRCDAE